MIVFSIFLRTISTKKEVFGARDFQSDGNSTMINDSTKL